MTVGMGIEQQGCAGTISEGGDIWEKLLEEWEAMSLGVELELQGLEKLEWK